MCESGASAWQGMERDHWEPDFLIQCPVCLHWQSPPDEWMGTFILSSICSHRNLLPWMLSGIDICCWTPCDTGTWSPNNVCLQKPGFLWRQLPPHPAIQRAPKYTVQMWKKVGIQGRGQKMCNIMWGFWHLNQWHFLIGLDSSDVVFHSNWSFKENRLEFG